jgi:hypothetical protein
MQQLVLQIPTPCHENWDAMHPAEQGRFCLSCQKTVVDFSNMTDQQVLQYLQRAQGDTCGRLATDQLNRPLTQQPVRRNHFWAKLVFQFLFPAFVFTQKAKAQGAVAMLKVKPPVSKVPHQQLFQQQLPVLKGKITDSLSGEAIAQASIKIKGTLSGTQSAQDGSFIVPPLSKGQPFTLQISCIGYQSRELNVTDLSMPLDIQLTAQVMELAPVVVSSGSSQGKIKSGLIFSTTTTTIRRDVPLLKRITDTLTGKNNIRLYPNPVTRGNALQLNMQKVQKGPYRLQLFSMAGSLVQQELITVPATEFNFQWQLGSQVAAGGYIVNLINAKGKVIHNSKIIVL